MKNVVMGIVLSSCGRKYLLIILLIIMMMG